MNIRLTDQELSDSLRYASQIQAAMLPSARDIKHILPESFVLYLPRDVVSGDFYWIVRRKNRIAIAAADCTGHGVPGAFMSMMGISFLNQLAQHCVPLSNKLLNQLREHVMRALHQEGREKEQKDGIDMALCVIDLDRQHLEYSGANNYLYYFKDNELLTIRPDRMPIGVSPVPEETFTRHTLPLNEIDSFYLFSDGYPDQFGGPFCKKLKINGFKALLEKTALLPLAQQKEFLANQFNSWKGNCEQIDDILVIGIGTKPFIDEAQRIQN
jgi:serine phosphatase RsbU (regulator of sigma subunit)